MHEALIKMLNQSISNLEAAHYWLEGKNGYAHTQSTLGVAEDLIHDAIKQLKDIEAIKQLRGVE